MLPARALLRSLVVSALVVGVASATAVLARPSLATPPATLPTGPPAALPTGLQTIVLGVDDTVLTRADLSVTAVPPPVPAAHVVKRPVARVARPALPRVERVRRPVVRESRQAYADRRGRAALATLRFPTERLGYAIVFRPYTGGFLGLAESGPRTVTLYVGRQHTEQQLRITLAHEIGHVVDYVTSTSASRQDYLKARGLTASRPWFPCNNCSDYASPAGDFAEVFALWLAGPGDFRSQLAGPPRSPQLADLGRRFFQPPAPTA